MTHLLRVGTRVRTFSHVSCVSRVCLVCVRYRTVTTVKVERPIMYRVVMRACRLRRSLLAMLRTVWYLYGTLTRAQDFLFYESPRRVRRSHSPASAYVRRTSLLEVATAHTILGFSHDRSKTDTIYALVFADEQGWSR